MAAAKVKPRSRDKPALRDQAQSAPLAGDELDALREAYRGVQPLQHRADDDALFAVTAQRLVPTLRGVHRQGRSGSLPPRHDQTTSPDVGLSRVAVQNQPAAWIVEGTEDDIRAARRDRGLGWLRRQKLGRSQPQATLDLHGLTRAAAFDALQRFLARCAAQGKHRVAVITGKGLHSGQPHGGRPHGGHRKCAQTRGTQPGDRPGGPRQSPPWQELPHWRSAQGSILRPWVIDWLRDGICPEVIGFCTTPARLGGSGALWVLLRDEQHL